MFSTCIFCQKSLGDNEVLEAFPVGRRLAFDASKGRLWVVCRHCERWNLSPLDTRWEAIEACERTYAETNLRVATDNIGLAKLKEGLELVRIGAPMRPEFAAWRYGDQFGRRRRRSIIIGGGLAVGIGALFVGGAAAGISMGGFAGMWGQIPNIINGMRYVRVKTPNGQVIKVRGTEFTKARLSATPSTRIPEFSFKHKNNLHTYRGEEALQMASKLLPSINGTGGSKRAVQEAVEQIELRRGSEAFIGDLLSEKVVPLHKQKRSKYQPKAVTELPSAARLALEMALHEEAERRAIEGELTMLEAAWREADEVANIADNLLVPATVEEQFTRLKQSGDKPSED